MSENRKDSSMEADLEIRIERLNTDKTRKDIGSDTVYHVYFELSGHPPPEWTIIFKQEWKKLVLKEEVDIDEAFLVLHCQLSEVPTSLLPLLKKAVAATNAAYKQYVQKAATALERQEDAWKRERTDVERMATSLRFD